MKPNKLITVAEWAEKNGMLRRRAWRLVQAKKIPIKKMAVYITGVPAEFKLPKAKK